MVVVALTPTLPTSNESSASVILAINEPPVEIEFALTVIEDPPSLAAFSRISKVASWLTVRAKSDWKLSVVVPPMVPPRLLICARSVPALKLPLEILRNASRAMLPPPNPFPRSWFRIRKVASPATFTRPKDQLMLAPLLKDPPWLKIAESIELPADRFETLPKIPPNPSTPP